MPLLHHPPLRELYLLYFVLKTFIFMIPFWVLISLQRSTRPKPSWSIRKCLHIYLLRAILVLPAKLGLVPKRDLTQEVADSTLRDAKFAWVDGIADDRLLTGDLQKYAEKAGVKPAKIPGYWQLGKGQQKRWTPSAKPGEKVLYHLHGGAFWMGSAHPADATARIPWGILEHSRTIARTFALDYRLSASAPFKVENPFPAALLDSLAGYQYLVGLGFEEKNIVVVGDSAGGNLALALVRHLTENATGLAKPGKLILLSPWGDLSASRTGPDSSLAKNRATDMFPVKLPGKWTPGSYGVTSYIGTGAEPADPKTNKYLSPSSPHLGEAEKGMFTGFPEAYILAGGAEILLDDAEVIAERMKKDSEGQKDWITLDVVEDAIHDFCVFPWHEPERGEALARLGKWIDGDQKDADSAKEGDSEAPSASIV